MVKTKKKRLYIAGLAAFAVYVFVFPRPVPGETVLKPRWISSLESDYPVSLSSPASAEASVGEDEGAALLPFTAGDRFGYIGDDGRFAVNQIRRGYVSLAENLWAEYEAVPSSIQFMNPQNEGVFAVENPGGYPFLLDGRVFIVGREQNSITELGADGEELWTHDFPAPLTCVDAAAGLLLAGTLDGAVELLDSSGRLVFTPFEPGGSRLSVILGCAISRDGSRFALISGIGEQRFLLLENSSDTYRVVYHEFLSDGFRRPVHIVFADNDSKVVFEREGGLGIFSIGARGSVRVTLEGEITALDNSGGDGLLFVITSQGPKEKRLISIRYSGIIVNQTPFKSGNAFLARRGRRLYLGGDLLMASFELEKGK